MELIFELEGYQVRCLNDGTAALNVAKSYCPDIVLLDINLGAVSGLDVCRQIKTQYNSMLPVLMVSVEDDIAAKIRIQNVPADDFVEKPFDITNLTQKVRQHISAH
ncbi:response regulator transcription factor [Pedobacter aquatilis]|uniref:response regulator transcription factor n=1 Tax=Pedobacter aquatilis TaxID=351343 RepID=UPI00292E9C1E|nr:response regulator [Pedobacter aquatilis]